MLHINELTYRVGGRTLIDAATVAIPQGHKTALVGRNGAGKSTLFKLIAGDLQPDGGAISLPSNARIGMVAQEAPGGPESLLDAVLAADTERTALLAEAETASDPNRIGEIHARLADIDAHTAAARAAAILSGLGFDAEAQARPCSDFSGGWRMRVALAAVLFLQPDLLLLDEPTNHLDLEATIWLENYLKNYPHTILLISHDRELLNAIPEMTIHLDNGKLTAYRGNYDRFERTRREQIELLAAQAQKQAAQRAHMQAFIDRFRYKASKARQAQSRIKALERMAPIVGIVEQRTPSFAFPSPPELAPPLVTFEGAAVGYGDRVVLRNLDLRLDPDDRIALLGANGNGKSTLVRLIADRLKPMAGRVTKSGKIKVGYFAQHQTEELNPALTPLAQAKLLMPQVTEEKVRAHLGRFGFGQDRSGTTIGSLSGGEKARLLFALMSREAPHILLLDEPTNHLDIDSRAALIQALADFEGAVVLVSHDPYLVETCADRLWLVAEGTCRSYDGDLDDYRRLLLEQRRAERTTVRSGASGRKSERKAAAAARAAVAPLRRKAEAAERAIARLTAEKQMLETQLADPEAYKRSAADITSLQIALSAKTAKLTAAEEEWLEAHAAIEEAMAAA
jgi:ATP-binding cassette subfamily F protein 3